MCIPSRRPRNGQWATLLIVTHAVRGSLAAGRCLQRWCRPDQQHRPFSPNSQLGKLAVAVAGARPVAEDVLERLRPRQLGVVPDVQTPERLVQRHGNVLLQSADGAIEARFAKLRG